MMEKGDDGDVHPRNGGLAVDTSEMPDVKELASVETQIWDIFLRLMAFIFTFIATIIMSLAKENKTVQIQISTSLDNIPVLVRAKSTYTSAFVYFIVVNAIACGYSGLSLLLTMGNKALNGHAPIHMTLAIAIFDLVMVGLLYSATGAAVAIGLVGKNGNSHVGWNKICGVFGRFCNLVTASNVLSFFAALFYFAVVLLCVFNLHKKSLRR